MEITIKDILAKTPKADCKSVCEVDFKSGTTAKQVIQDEVNLWVKNILEGKIKENSCGEWASYPQPIGMKGCIENSDKDQKIKLANMKGDIRMGFHTDTGRCYQLGLWRKTVITLNTFKVDGHLQMVPSKAQITTAYDWAIKVLED